MKVHNNKKRFRNKIFKPSLVFVLFTLSITLITLVINSMASLRDRDSSVVYVTANNSGLPEAASKPYIPTGVPEQTISATDVTDLSGVFDFRVTLARFKNEVLLSVVSDGYIGVKQWSPNGGNDYNNIPMTPDSKEKLQKIAWQQPKAPKLILLQLDSMNALILNEAIKAGLMPATSVLMNNGSYGNLESCCGTLSPAVWTTITTGVAPTVHGIDDFSFSDKSTGELIEYNYTNINKPRIWEILDKYGKKSFVGGVLLPDPAYEKFAAYTNTIEKMGIVKADIEKNNPEFVTIYENRADHDCHLWWWAKDPALFRESGWNFNDESARFNKDRIMQAYRQLDSWVAFALSISGPETIIMALSDHGSQPTAGEFSQFSIEADFFVNNILPPGFWPCSGNGPDDWLAVCTNDPDKISPAIEVLSDVKSNQTGRLFSANSTTDENGGKILIELNGEIVAELLDLNSKVSINGKEYSPDRLFQRNTSGSHNRDGFFIIAGNNINKNVKIDNPSVFDIMPNMLALLGVPLASQMPGRIWGEVYLYEPQTKLIEEYRYTNKVPVNTKLTGEKYDKLKTLGYIN